MTVDGELAYEDVGGADQADAGKQPQSAERAEAIGGRLRYPESWGGEPILRPEGDTVDRRATAGRGNLRMFTPETAHIGNQAKAERRELRRQAFIRGLVSGVGSLVPNVRGDEDMVAAIGDAVGQVAVTFDDKRMIQAATLALKAADVLGSGKPDSAGSGSSVQLTLTGDAADRLAAVLGQRLTENRTHNETETE